jgi:hypothetical protein
MTGCDNNNYARFAYLLQALRAAGIDAQSPHLLEANIPNEMKGSMDKGRLYRMVIPGDIYMLSTCDGFIGLPGWEASEGTGYELAGARLFRQDRILAPAGGVVQMGRDGLTDEFKRWVDHLIKRLKEGTPIG